MRRDGDEVIVRAQQQLRRRADDSVNALELGMRELVVFATDDALSKERDDVRTGAARRLHQVQRAQIETGDQPVLDLS